MNRYDELVALWAYDKPVRAFVGEAVCDWLEAMGEYIDPLPADQYAMMLSDCFEAIQEDALSTLPDEWVAGLIEAQYLHVQMKHGKGGFLSVEERRLVKREIQLRAVLWKLNQTNNNGESTNG